MTWVWASPFPGDSVNIKTGVKMSTSGIEALGFGVSLEGDNDTKVSNNLMNLLSDIANAFRSNDLTSMEDYSAKLGKQKNNLMLSISDIGSRTNFLSRITQRLENDNLNLTERQSGLESVDPAEGGDLQYHVRNVMACESATGKQNITDHHF